MLRGMIENVTDPVFFVGANCVRPLLNGYRSYRLVR